jgi:hypothetical protein
VALVQQVLALEPVQVPGPGLVQRVPLVQPVQRLAVLVQRRLVVLRLPQPSRQEWPVAVIAPRRQRQRQHRNRD